MMRQKVREVILETVEDPSERYFSVEETPDVAAGWSVEAMLRVRGMETVIMRHSDGRVAVAPKKSAGRSKVVKNFSSDGTGEAVRLAPITGAEAFGGGIALATEEGLFRLCPMPGSSEKSCEYALLDPAAMLPEIEFCMVRSDMAEFAGTDGGLPECRLSFPLGAGEKSAVETWLAGGLAHDALPESFRKRVEEKTVEVFESFRSAADGRNLFITPFMVMYALVDRDGGRLAVSPPVLMLPSSGNPALRIDRSSLSESMAVVEATFMSRPCRLALRVVDMPEATRLSGIATGVEIYVAVTRDNASPGPLRRRVCSLFSHSSATLFGDDCGEELLDGSGRSVALWDCPGDEEKMMGLLAEAEFHKIADLPLEEMATGRSAYVVFNSASLAAVLEGRAEAVAPDHSVMRRVKSGRLFKSGGRLHIVAPEEYGAGVYAPRVAFPYSATAAGETGIGSFMILSSLVRKEGKAVKGEAPFCSLEGMYVTCVSPGGGKLRPVMPRWLFVADPYAETLVVDCGGYQRSFPLRRHPRLHGSYWFGGLDFSEEPALAGRSVPAAFSGAAESFEDRRIFLTSTGREGLCFSLTGESSAMSGEIIALGAALRNVGQGELGEFPLYAFTDDGVWIMTPRPGGGYTGVMPVTRLGVAAASDIAPHERGVVFRVDDGSAIGRWRYFAIEGARVTELDTPTVSSGGLITSDPLPLGSDGRKRVLSVSLSGAALPPDAVVRIQASDNLREWVTLAEGTGEIISGIVGARYRYFRLQTAGASRATVTFIGE